MGECRGENNTESMDLEIILTLINVRVDVHNVNEMFRNYDKLCVCISACLLFQHSKVLRLLMDTSVYQSSLYSLNLDIPAT